jgi:asparagine synthase (glutamine-hydrolysing)
MVPAGVRQPPKQPYRAPDAKCFVSADRNGRLPEYVETLLAPHRVREDGIFNPVGVGQLLAKARSGQTIGIKNNMGFVGVLSTQLVLDRFVRSRIVA